MMQLPNIDFIVTNKIIYKVHLSRSVINSIPDSTLYGGYFRNKNAPKQFLTWHCSSILMNDHNYMVLTDRDMLLEKKVPVYQLKFFVLGPTSANNRAVAAKLCQKYPPTPSLHLPKHSLENANCR
jgi:hypothetical protein